MVILSATNSLLADIVRFRLSRIADLMVLFPSSNRCGISQTTLIGGLASLLTHHSVSVSTKESCLHPYKECFIPLSKRRGISQSTLIGGSVSSLTQHSVSVFDTICKDPKLTLANIVRFGSLRIASRF